MNDMTQQPFAAAQFADNVEPRCGVVILVDTSGSMKGEPIAQLNAGIAAFSAELQGDSLAAKRVELALVTFGPKVEVVCGFGPVETFDPPQLVAHGGTPMGEAIKKAIELIRERKGQYREAAIPSFRPWIVLITDGEPTDEWTAAARAVATGEAGNSFAFYAIGVDGANMTTLTQIATRTPLRLRGLAFTDLFAWLSSSLSMLSRSSPGAGIALVDPTGPSGWALVD